MEKHSNMRVGVYVDVANIAQNGGYGMQYDILRLFACRVNGVAIRLNAYVAYDEEQAKTNWEYRQKSLSFHSVLRDFGYKVIVKPVRWFTDEHGTRFGKANADLDMAVDALLQSERLDSVLLITGDGDFVQVVRALQNKGCRVEALAFKNVAHTLRNETDMFTSGYLVPGLLPIINADQDKRVERGICYSYHPDKKYGFLRFMKKLDGHLWITDSRKDESPYETAFVHASQFPADVDWNTLPSREMIFEFDLKWIMEKNGWQAENLKLIYSYRT
jgi:uncharacterized LabA/DUF88 family protein